MNHNKDSSSMNIYNLRIANCLTKNKGSLFSIIMSILKTVKLIGNLLLLKNGHLLPTKDLNSPNYCSQQWTHGELIS